MTARAALQPESVLGSLRSQVREVIEAELGAGRIQRHCDSWVTGWDERFSQTLAAHDWVGMTIPTTYGGHGRSAVERWAVTEELLAAGAPVAAHWFADRQVAPSLLRYGTELQRERYLPAIAKGRCYFAIGMSEPDAGSDLASVRTRATRVDGGWQISGTKVWTSGAHRAHAFFVLGRTSPRDERHRHAGLSQFIVSLDSPGIEIRPIRLLSGEHHFNEVRLDAVFVPDSAVLGEIGAGWTQVTSELAYERSGPERFLSTYPLLTAFLDEAHDGSTVAAERVGAVVARLWTLREMSSQIARSLERHEPQDVQAAVVKEMGNRFETELIDSVRLMADDEPSFGSRALPRLMAEALVQSPGFTIRGGTTEILRGIIARDIGVR